MDPSELGAALSNQTRVNLLQLLSEDNYGASEAHEKYNETFDEGKHRESIYRELEKLVESGLVKKDYSQKEKRLVYNLQYCSAEIDFLTGTVEMIENADN